MALIASLFSAASARAVTIDLVTVGNPGNANDVTGFGGVAYSYSIGKYAVTIGQYTEFLNAVAQTDTYQLYSTQMADNPIISGISRSGTSGAYSYSVLAASGSAPYGGVSAANRPITYVSWWDAARFANWVANGQPTGAQTSTTTENGAYNVNGKTTGIAPARNATNPNTGATPTYVIPTENEWYKAAYYSPALNSGSGGYYTYATQSNAAPGNVPGSGVNQANYYTSVFSVTQNDTTGNQNFLTDVGAFTNSASYYGTFDQSGNVSQWNDRTGAASNVRQARGGQFDLDALQLSSSAFTNYSTSHEGYMVGFRLASPVVVPEPSTWVMGAVGLAGVAWGAVRRRRRSGWTCRHL